MRLSGAVYGWMGWEHEGDRHFGACTNRTQVQI